MVKYDKFTDTSVSEIMSLSEIRVFQNSDILYFIIKYPLPIMKCKKISVFPVPHQQKILSLERNQVAICDGQTLSVKNCKAAIMSTFCNIDTLKSCAQQLLAGGTAQCKTEFNKLEKIVTIEDGIIIINDSPFSITEDGVRSENPKGTYVITFETEVTINGTKHINRNGIMSKVPVTPNLSNINITAHKDTLSLPFLHDMNLVNLERINEIKSKLIMSPIMTALIMMTLLIILVATFRTVKALKRERSLEDMRDSLDAILRKSEDALNISQGGVNTRT